MGKKEPIMNHGQLKDSINYKALIEAQASTPVFPEASIVENQKQKVKKIGGKRPNYRRSNSK